MKGEESMNDNIYSLDSNENISFSKIFGWLFVGISITGILSYLTPWLCINFFGLEALYGCIVVGALIVLIVPFVINIKTLFSRNAKKIIGWFVVDAIGMGMLLSSIWFVYEATAILTALLVSAGVFGIMALYGFLTKKDLNHLGVFGIILLSGALLVSLINFFIGSTITDYVVSIVVLVAVLALVAFDMYRIRRLVNSGIVSSNLAIYFAFMLYTDFINIFIRILAIMGDSRR